MRLKYVEKCEFLWVFKSLIGVLKVLEGYVFAIGGFNGVTTIFLVECYDAERDEWYREKWGLFKQFFNFFLIFYIIGSQQRI